MRDKGAVHVINGVIVRLKRSVMGSQLRRNMVSGVITTGFNTVVALVTYPIYLHYLGFETVGVWMLLTTVMSIAQLCSLGIGPAVTKLVAEEFGRNNIGGVQANIITALCLITAMGAVAFTGMLFFSHAIVGIFALHGENAAMALRFLPLMGLLTIYVFQIQVFSSGLSGLGRMDQANYRDCVCRVVNFVASVFLLWSGFGIAGVFAGTVLSNILMHVMSIVLLKRACRMSLTSLRCVQFARCRRMLSFGSGALGSSLLLMLLNPLNKLLISRYIGVGAIPIYEMANVSTMQIRNLIESAIRAVMPEVSRLGSTEGAANMQKVKVIYKKSLRLVWVLGTPLFLAFFIFAPFALRLWLHHSFTDTIVPTFRIMLIGTFFSLLCVPGYYILMGCHGITHCFFSTVVQVSVNVFAALLLIYVFGGITVYGMAGCAALAHIGTATYIIIQMRRCVTLKLFPGKEAACAL